MAGAVFGMLIVRVDHGNCPRCTVLLSNLHIQYAPDKKQRWLNWKYLCHLRKFGSKMRNFYSKLKFVHWLDHIDLLQTSEHLKIVNFSKFLNRGVTASFIAVLPRIFVLFEYSINMARIIVFVFIFVEFPKSKYYSNIWIIDLNTTNNLLIH